MKHALISLARTAPALLEHTSIRIFLRGWPAATAIAAVGATVVAVVGILSGRQIADPAD